MTQILSTVYDTETVGTGTETNNKQQEQQQQGLKLPVLEKCLCCGGERLERVNSTRACLARCFYTMSRCDFFEKMNIANV